MGCQCSQPGKEQVVQINDGIPIEPEDPNPQRPPENKKDPDETEEKKSEKVEPENTQNNQNNQNAINNNNQNSINNEQKNNPQNQDENKKIEQPKSNDHKDEQEDQQQKPPQPIQPAPQKNKKVYDISKYPTQALDLINQVRRDPPKFCENIEKAISCIKTEKGKLIYAGDLKVALNRGEEAFREAIEVLKKIQPLEPLTMKNEIIINLPSEENEIKDPKVFQDKIIQKKKEVELDMYFKDAIKDPYISILLMVVDDSGKNAGKKREIILSKDYKNIGIACTMVKKTFCAYYTFSK